MQHRHSLAEPAERVRAGRCGHEGLAEAGLGVLLLGSCKRCVGVHTAPARAPWGSAVPGHGERDPPSLRPAAPAPLAAPRAPCCCPHAPHCCPCAPRYCPNAPHCCPPRPSLLPPAPHTSPAARAAPTGALGLWGGSLKAILLIPSLRYVDHL